MTPSISEALQPETVVDATSTQKAPRRRIVGRRTADAARKAAGDDTPAIEGSSFAIQGNVPLDELPNWAVGLIVR